MKEGRLPRRLEVGGGSDGWAAPVSDCRQKEKEGVWDGPVGRCWLGRVGYLARGREDRKAGGPG
jgi:hypothetical protein